MGLYFFPFSTPDYYILVTIGYQRQRMPSVVRNLVKWLWSRLFVKLQSEEKQTGDMKNIRSKQTWWNLHLYCPTFFCSIHGNSVGSGLRHSVLAGYYFGELEMGVCWPTLQAFSPTECFFVCLSPFFSYLIVCLPIFFLVL